MFEPRFKTFRDSKHIGSSQRDGIGFQSIGMCDSDDAQRTQCDAAELIAQFGRDRPAALHLVVGFHPEVDHRLVDAAIVA